MIIEFKTNGKNKERFLGKKMNSKKNLLIEFFGLSRTGKTTYRKKLEEKGYKFNSSRQFKRYPIIIRFYYFMKYFVKYPLRTIYFFYKLNSNYLKLEKFSVIQYVKIFLIKNLYLSRVLSDSELARQIKGPVVLEDFSHQAIFMILQRKAFEKEIKILLKILPKPDVLYIFETDKRTRYERLKKTRFPHFRFGKDYPERWMRNSEYNYKIIKKIYTE